MMPPPTRKCSKKNCPATNISPYLTWYCYCCKCPIHLLCYGVVKSPEDIFVNDNIVMVCDECLNNPKEDVSPKRKQPSMVQRTIDSQGPVLTLSKTVVTGATPSKNTTVKQAQQNQHFQSVIESLVQKVDVQTAAIAGLKSTVVTLNDTIGQHQVTVGESIKITNENFSLIKKSINQTPRFNQSAKKKSYADAAREGIGKTVPNETPKSSKQPRTAGTSKPVLAGTSNNVIGKPLSPILSNRSDRPKAPPKPEKAIWISRIHRETTEAELSAYIKESIGIASDEINVRKLVKKDRDISAYSFVSFRITCSSANFNTLMNPMYWPSNSQIREFDLDQKSSTGVKLNQDSDDVKIDSKNEEQPEKETMEVEEGLNTPITTSNHST